MKKIKIVAVDRTRASFLKEGELFYLGRIKRYVSTEIVEVKPVKITKSRKHSEILSEEGQSIQKKLNPGDYIFALDRSGKSCGSKQLSRRIEKLFASLDCIVFIIGGPLGLSRKIISIADEVLSLSKLTFTHEMTRLIIMEQIYRSFTLIRGEKYHK